MKSVLKRFQAVYDFAADQTNINDKVIDAEDFCEWLNDVEWNLRYDDGTEEGILFDLSENPKEAFWQLVTLYIQEKEFDYE